MEQTFSIFDLERLTSRQLKMFLENIFERENEYLLEVALQLNSVGLLRPCPLNNSSEEIRKAWKKYYLETSHVAIIRGEGLLEVYHDVFITEIYTCRRRKFQYGCKTNYVPDDDYINRIHNLNTDDIIDFVGMHEEDGALSLNVFLKELAARKYSEIDNSGKELIMMRKSSNRRWSLTIRMIRIISALIFRMAINSNNEKVMSYVRMYYSGSNTEIIIPGYVPKANTLKDYAYMVVGMIYSIIGYNPFFMNIQMDLNRLIDIIVTLHNVDCDELFTETYRLLSNEETKYLVKAVLEICPQSKLGKFQQLAATVRLPRLRIE